MEKAYKFLMVFTVLILGMAASVYGLDVSVNDYDPRPAEAGKAVNVWFKIDNPTNDPIEDIYVQISPKDGLDVTSGEASKKKVGIIAGRSSQIVQFRLLVDKSAFKGIHVVELELLKGSVQLSKIDLPIEVTDKDFKNVNLEVGDVESDPRRIKPDDENVKLDVTIQNLGDGRAQGVKAQLINLPEGVTFSESYSGLSLLGNVDADSTSTATFYIDVDESVESIQHTAGIMLTYKYKQDQDEDDYTFEEVEIPLDIAIKPIPLYEIIQTELTPAVLTAGDDGVKLKLTIKNIGDEKGESVRVKAYGKTEQPINFDDSSDFVAPSLEPGETGQATLQFDIDEDANLQKYYLDIEIKNIVNDDVLTYTEKVPVTVSNPMPDNPWKLVGFGVILMGIVVIFIISKNIKKKKTRHKPKKVSGSYGKSYFDKEKKD